MTAWFLGRVKMLTWNVFLFFSHAKESCGWRSKNTDEYMERTRILKIHARISDKRIGKNSNVCSKRRTFRRTDQRTFIEHMCYWLILNLTGKNLLPYSEVCRNFFSTNVQCKMFNFKNKKVSEKELSWNWSRNRFCSPPSVPLSMARRISRLLLFDLEMICLTLITMFSGRQTANGGKVRSCNPLYLSIMLSPPPPPTP